MTLESLLIIIGTACFIMVCSKCGLLKPFTIVDEHNDFNHHQHAFDEKTNLKQVDLIDSDKIKSYLNVAWYWFIIITLILQSLYLVATFLMLFSEPKIVVLGVILVRLIFLIIVLAHYNYLRKTRGKEKISITKIFASIKENL